jgi:signal transduction histidine kinase
MRRRVLLLVGATMSLVLIAFLLPLALLLRTVAADRAIQTAMAALQATNSVAATTDRAALELSTVQLDTTSPYDITLYLADGSRYGAPVPASPLVQLGLRGASASADVEGGREIVSAVRDAAGHWAAIRAFVPDAELSHGVTRSWFLLAGLGAALLLISLAVADALARSLVRSSIALASVSHRLARGELDARADPNGPGELGVVAGALNRLAARIADLVREERETVADLAHRVRTPLTALRLEAEALPDAEDAARIGAGVDAVQHAVTGAIEQARCRGGPGRELGADAAAVVAERVAFWAVLAEDTDRSVVTELVTGPLPVAVTTSDLVATVDALLGNVFAHTADGTAFTVRLTARPGGGATLTVSDAGPGLPVGASALMRGVSGTGSTGLGLTSHGAVPSGRVGRCAWSPRPTAASGSSSSSARPRTHTTHTRRVGILNGGIARAQPTFGHRRFWTVEPVEGDVMSFARAAAVVVGVVLFLVLYNGGVGQTATRAPLQATTGPVTSDAPVATVPVAAPAAGDPARARRIALDRLGGGTVTKTELDSDDGRSIWKIDVVKGTTRHEVKIDDATGTVLETEIEDGPEHPDSDGDGDGDGD